MTGCSLYMIVYICMSYMLVRLSRCLNHIKGTIIIIIIIINSFRLVDNCINEKTNATHSGLLVIVARDIPGQKPLKFGFGEQC